MKNSPTKRYTIANNVPGELVVVISVRVARPLHNSVPCAGTHNILCAVVESGIDAHIVHLGTMGVYGYGTSGGEIPGM
jgi:nucleoside-diphosphate-sugar epimerase